VKTPTWNEVEEFCRKDGWELVRSTGHSFYRKVLPDGTVLETHTSFSGDKTMSPGRFAAILRTQLKVSPEAFWETLRSGQPVRRPSESIPVAGRRPSA
jgi:predicted RNA binding protein YcfA (HicA-like mRNA interferase family)